MYFAAIMALSIRVRNQSIVDIFWGPGFVLVAAVSYLASRHSGGDDVRRLVVLALTAIWGCDSGCTSASATSGTAKTRATTRS